MHSIQDIIDKWSNSGFIKNPLAEKDGIIWDLESPARNVNEDFFSGIFTATTNPGPECVTVGHPGVP